MDDLSPMPAGHLIELQPIGESLGSEFTTTLIESNGVRIIRIVVPSGRNVPRHVGAGESILHCLEGCVELRTRDGKSAVKAGQLIYLRSDEPFSIYGIENSSLLLTVVKPKAGPNVEVVG
jgi:quercetin dioxygenase-like cupin family protein